MKSIDYKKKLEEAKEVKFSNKKLTEDEFKKIERNCLFCDKKITLLCGSPKVVFGNYTKIKDQTGTTTITRQSHISCYLNYLNQNANCEE